MRFLRRRRTSAAASNPWLTIPTEAAAIDEPAPERAVPETVTTPSGPATPQAGVPAPLAEDRLPVRPVSGPAGLWMLGVHGGAGESSLTALVAGAREAGHAWPHDPNGGRPHVVLIARTNWSGLKAAEAAAREWAAGGVSVELLGLVFVADAPGSLPSPLRKERARVAGGVPRAWELPWVQDWRLEPASLENAPRAARAVAEELADLAIKPGAEQQPDTGMEVEQ